MMEVLLNSLWQGAFVVAIASGVTTLLPQRHAATRYAVWYVALFALAVLPIASQFSFGESASAIPSSVIRTTSAASHVTEAAATNSGFWLALAWVAGIVFNSGRLALSYLRLARIIRTAVPARELGASVRISSTISIPIAAGIFSPTIVLPEDLAAKLDPVDLRSIVAHERAHISRNDVLGNLIQRLFEAAFFFNPWVYVIGRQLVKEREAACDDLAVQAASDPDRYASCLLNLAQRSPNTRTPLLTPSAIGSGRMLAQRIVRLLNGKGIAVKVNYFVPAAAVALFAVLGLAFQTAGIASQASGAANNEKLAANCSADVTIVNPVQPQISKPVKAPAKVEVLVTVTKAGTVSSVKMMKSSGNTDIDGAVAEAATHSTYKPEIRNCAPVSGGQYVFTAVVGP
ncbi:MAG TPA: M56 family metallopeptidase [Candidatus Acidoferrales bacterium]|nr:M56 family metallopeptidase [Candidatus Acidoferrales bacterium]